MFERKREMPPVDTRLLPYLEAQDDAAAEWELGLLFVNHLEGMIDKAVRKQTGVYLGGAESGGTQAEDAAAELRNKVKCSLLDKLIKLRDGKARPIAYLWPYVKRIARNDFIEYLGEKYPHRRRIRNRMYDYVVRERISDGLIRVWEDGEDKVYGLAEHDGREVVVNENYNLLIQYPDDFKRKFFSAEQLNSWKLSNGPDAVKGRLMAELLRAILSAVNGPVEANYLEDAIVRMTGGDAVGGTVSGGPGEDGDEDSPALEEMSSEPSQEAEVLGAETIPDVWKEICSWNLTKRRAHFLKKDIGDIVLFIANGISERQIVAALGMTLAEFREVRDRLPLSDQEIASLFSARPGTIGNAASKAKKLIERRFGQLFGLRKRKKD